MSDPGWCPARLLLPLLVTLLLCPAAAAALPEDALNSSQARPRDKTPLILTLTEPSDGAIVTTPTIVVRGTTTDERPVTVQVEDHRVLVTARTFDTDVSLHRGENHFEVEAQNDAGNRTSLTRTVRFEDLSRIQSLAEPLLAVADLRDLAHLALAPDGARTAVLDRVVVHRALARDQLGALWLTARKKLPAPGTGHEDDADDDGTDDDDVTDKDLGRGVLLKLTPERTWTDFTTGLDTPAGLVFDPHGDLLVVEVKLGRMLRFRAPPTPQVAAPAPTNDASVSLAGTAEPSVQVVARGPAGVGTAQADTEGCFQVSLPLLPDQTNQIEIFAAAVLPEDAFNSSQARPRDKTPLILTLTEPSDGTIVTTPTIVVRGTVTDERPVTVQVEGHRVLVIAGTLTTEIRLQRKDLKRLS